QHLDRHGPRTVVDNMDPPAGREVGRLADLAAKQDLRVLAISQRHPQAASADATALNLYFATGDIDADDDAADVACRRGHRSEQSHQQGEDHTPVFHGRASLSGTCSLLSMSRLVPSMARGIWTDCRSMAVSIRFHI